METLVFLLFLSNSLTSSATGPRVLTRPCWQMRQVSFEDKEAETCQLFDDRQRYCTEEMEGLKQRCSTKLRQASQMAAKAQQALQLQVRQLQVSATPPRVSASHQQSSSNSRGDAENRKQTAQTCCCLLNRAFLTKKTMFAQAENERLQEDVSKLSREKGLVELRLKSYETEKTHLAPTLEETQWEVSPQR